MDFVSNNTLIRAGLAPLTTVRSKEHARQQAVDSLVLAQMQRCKIMNLIQQSKAGQGVVKHNIIDFGGAYEDGTGEDWARINNTYLCEYVIVSLANGSVKKTSNTYSPHSTDICIGFPTTASFSVHGIQCSSHATAHSDTLNTFFSMVGDYWRDPSALMILIGHAVNQVDPKFLCTPIQDLVRFSDQVLAPIYKTPAVDPSTIDAYVQHVCEYSDPVDPAALGGAGLSRQSHADSQPYVDNAQCAVGSLILQPIHNVDTRNISSPVYPALLQSISSADPWASPPSTSNGSMLRMMGSFFAHEAVDSIKLGGKATHISHEICLTSSPSVASPGGKVNRKMVSVHHTMSPINPNHCLATLVLHDTSTGESYTHVGVLDIGHGKKSHANLVASFYALAKFSLSSGSPGASLGCNPFHVSSGRIEQVVMDGYDTLQVSKSLSFFYTPIMQVQQLGSTSSPKEYEVSCFLQIISKTIFIGRKMMC